MGCNAYNHPPDCDCGFGGDTGVYGVFNNRYFDNRPVKNSSLLNSIKRTPGERVATNAHCPVCGDPVFFYESPSGGKVFFDDLGPPWPKHPCTDVESDRSAITNREPQNNSIRYSTFHESGWKSLLVSPKKEYIVSSSANYDIDACFLYNLSPDDLLGVTNILPIPYRLGATEFVLIRIKYDMPVYAEITSIVGNGSAELYTVPIYIRNKKEAQEWIDGNDEPTSDQLFHLGRFFDPGGKPNPRKIENHAAFYCYKKASDDNHSDASNNLGVMMSRGNGLNVQNEKAVKYFEKSLWLNPTNPLARKNLIKHYQNGLGVEKDEEKARKLVNNIDEVFDQKFR